MNTIVLFDVDGTLITTSGVGKRALRRAIIHTLGLDDFSFRFSFAGMTDPVIVARGLDEAGHAADAHLIDQILTEYVRFLREEVARCSAYRVLDGVVQTLSALRDLPDVAVGLGTGNIRSGAHIKIERGGLMGYFEFGGYSCDAPERGALLGAGFTRGAQRSSWDLESCRKVVIGDTPRDIEAARANAAQVIAVATGGYGIQELAAFNPDLLVDSLARPGVLDFLI